MRHSTHTIQAVCCDDEAPSEPTIGTPGPERAESIRWRAHTGRRSMEGAASTGFAIG